MPQIQHLDPAQIEPWHEPTDEKKLTAITASMEHIGWQGPPLVVIDAAGQRDPIAVCGSHRIAAATAAGIDVPAVDLDDLLREHGTCLADVDADTGADSGDDFHTESVIRLDYYLPPEIIEFYGLDAH